MISFQKELDIFAEKTKAFCDWVEAEFTTPQDEMEKAERLLAELLRAILSLPEAGSIFDEVKAIDEKSRFTEKALWEKCRNKFENLPVNGYWSIFDASKIDEDEPVFGILADDLADIYGDLKIGLILYEQRQFAEAFYEWKVNFQIHWGNHLVDAQKVVRNYFSHNDIHHY